MSSSRHHHGSFYRLPSLRQAVIYRVPRRHLPEYPSSRPFCPGRPDGCCCLPGRPENAFRLGDPSLSCLPCPRMSWPFLAPRGHDAGPRLGAASTRTEKNHTNGPLIVTSPVHVSCLAAYPCVGFARILSQPYPPRWRLQDVLAGDWHTSNPCLHR